MRSESSIHKSLERFMSINRATCMDVSLAECIHKVDML